MAQQPTLTQASAMRHLIMAQRFVHWLAENRDSSANGRRKQTGNHPARRERQAH
jgi:hypothetical protein